MDCIAWRPIYLFILLDKAGCSSSICMLIKLIPCKNVRFIYKIWVILWILKQSIPILLSWNMCLLWRLYFHYLHCKNLILNLVQFQCTSYRLKFSYDCTSFAMILNYSYCSAQLSTSETLNCMPINMTKSFHCIIFCILLGLEYSFECKIYLW